MSSSLPGWQGVRAPISSSVVAFRPQNHSASNVLVPRKPSGDKKDLVTFLEALSNVLQENPTLSLSEVNALDGAYLSRGATFSVRRHKLRQPPVPVRTKTRKLSTGDTVILKTAHGYRHGRAEEQEGDDIRSEQMDALVREIQVLGHQRVRETDEIIDLLQLMWEFEQGVLRPVLMIEYANCGTLAEFLQSGRAAPWQAKAVLCGDVIKGLAALHEIGVVHGDIKCDNVLVCMEEKDGRPQAKLTDFGFSIFLAELEPGARCSVPGTQLFCAPEASKPVERDGLAYTDYFSLGMLVWQVLLEGKEDLFSQPPFECPSRMTSESAWSEYIQSAKQKDGFVDNVKSSILLAHDFGESWDHFSIILDNTLNPIPAQRNMEEVLALHGFASGPSWTTSMRAIKPHPDGALLDLRQFVSSSSPSLKAQIVASLEVITKREGDSRAAEACFLLAQCNIDGFGMKQSDEDGLLWLSKAASLGHEVAQEILPQIAAAVGAESDHECLCVPEFANLVQLPNPESYPIKPTDSPDAILRRLHQNSHLSANLTGTQDSILYWASTYGLSDHLVHFLDAFPDLMEAENVVGETPLICAARHGQAACVELLVNRGAKVDHVSALCETALHWLVSFSDSLVPAVGSLIFSRSSLESYATVAEPTPTESITGITVVPGTPLHRAVALRRRSVIEFLLECGADPFSSGMAMYDADILERIGAVGVPVPDDDDRAVLPIHLACRSHSDEIIELLLSDGRLKIPDWSSTVGRADRFLFPWEMDRDDGLGCRNFTSRSLLSYASDPASRFSRMVVHGRRQRMAMRRTFELLLSQPGQYLERVDFVGKTAILTACYAGDTELITFILTFSGSHSTLNESYAEGWGIKPIHVAAAANDLVAAKALLDAGANVLAERNNGETAIMFCATAFMPDQDMAKYLLSKGPELARIKSYGDSPFSAAVRNHDFECARLLLDHGADPNELLGPRSASTVLHHIAASDHELSALNFLLSLPEISFETAPRQKLTALHAPSLGRFWYNFSDEFSFGGTCDVIDAVLTRWHEKEHLEARDVRGYTALHFTCFARDVDATRLLLRAIVHAGADVNIMSDYFGNPIYETALDLVEDRSTVPGDVTERDPTAVELYEAKTAELRRLMSAAGAKRGAEILAERWGELSFSERTMAALLSNRVSRPFAKWGGFLNQARLMGPELFGGLEGLWSDRRPEEHWIDRRRQ